MSPTRRARSERRQSMTAVYAVMGSLLILILFQLLLLSVGMDDFVSGHRGVLWGAAIASGVCFAASCRLIALLTPGQRLGKQLPSMGGGGGRGPSDRPLPR